ncbi:malto-oligosyltrehalose synthase [Shumkonia mesophila]|uniref:malto-oligosyltrehalose synthase n=1 Tax=Shumkonia mesophila TaxID=2838854 RepID=UPI0029351199|nr:malto-oligosyltrehalose synthase [Shumkonia mesophila]
MSAADIPAIPRATYRLQFHGGFGFADAKAVVDYLDRLGISHLYASPYLKARAGSTHGYDIVDHNALNPEVGDEAAFAALCDALTERGMGQILDFVPNHMGVGLADNAWWLDVLEWGRQSPHAEVFDIDWRPAQAALRGKVLLPVLGDHYGRVLEAGELRLSFDAGEGSFSVWYYGHRFPISPRQYAGLLDAAVRTLAADADSGGREIEPIAAGFHDLRRPARSARGRAARREKARSLQQRLAAAVARHPALARHVEAAVARLNGTPGDAASFGPLHRLLESQSYRLAFWRVAAEEINYRRFFQINDLAGVRVEVPAVFDAVHAFVLRLIAEGRIHGLRIDHVDGLFDPRRYLERLQARARAAAGLPDGRPFYVVVEKILAGHERLREDWPVAGTTGYDFLNRVNGLFVDAASERPLSQVYRRLVGGPADFDEVAHEGRRQVMDLELASELRVLANGFNRLAEMSWLTRDHTLVGLRQALREVAACFPVYRTYVDARGATADDRRDLDWALSLARRRSRRADKSVFDFVHAALTTDLAAGRHGPYRRNEVRRLAMKFQQYTGPVTAKGVEDTAFYRFNRLISLNEVGGEPARFGTTASAFHHGMQERARAWPHAMLASATHDTKRGEDARARIDALSEIPGLWEHRVRRWRTLTRRLRVDVDGRPAPAANDEYLLYQALVGAWPAEFHGAAPLDADALDAFRERIVAYMAKAVREAKVHSSWIDPDQAYEAALATFIGRLLDGRRRNLFLDDFRAFHRRVAELGAVNALAQAVLKLTAPGVPDFYQGGELWDFSLVDPDNRRPVDFGLRRRLLDDLSRMAIGDGVADLLRTWPDGRIKLFVLWRLLSIRREHPEFFAEGRYEAVTVAGGKADHVVAFVRRNAGAALLVAVPRLAFRLSDTGRPFPLGADAWGDTALALPDDLASGAWSHLFTGAHPTAASDGRLAVADLLSVLPVAVALRTGVDG